MLPALRLLIIGYGEPGQMGNYLSSAAEKLGLDYQIMDMNTAETSSRIVQSFYWRFRGKRPAHLTAFARGVFDKCSKINPHVIVTTGGRVPLERTHIEKLRRCGVKVVNYSTDDPWNPVLRAPWFLSALPAYDVIFTPRLANVNDFRQSGVSAVHYLPFAYDPDVHHPPIAAEQHGAPSDVLFVGGCDAERLPLISAIADAGLSLALFGRYWNSHAKTRPFWRGVADQSTIRAASSDAAICLCLVRRANRDYHVMRSFEAAAIGGCILAEDTPDHRELFGPEGQAALYFGDIPNLVRQARTLKADAGLRERLSIGLRDRMSARKDTYTDRLAEMLRIVQASEVDQSTTMPV
jgi:spore maturation protein CgeB